MADAFMKVLVIVVLRHCTVTLETKKTGDDDSAASTERWTILLSVCRIESGSLEVNFAAVG